VHFDAYFNWQKTWTVTRNLETRILLFNRETKFTKTMQKLSKIHGQIKGVAQSPPPEYATALFGYLIY